MLVLWELTKLQYIHMKECHASFKYQYGGMCSVIGRFSIGLINEIGDYRTLINILILGHV